MSAELDALVEEARNDDDVLGLFVFGSRRSGMVADDRSDWDVGVVVRDDAALARFDPRHPYAHGALVEVASATSTSCVTTLRSAPTASGRATSTRTSTC